MGCCQSNRTFEYDEKGRQKPVTTPSRWRYGDGGGETMDGPASISFFGHHGHSGGGGGDYSSGGGGGHSGGGGEGCDSIGGGGGGGGGGS